MSDGRDYFNSWKLCTDGSFFVGNTWVHGWRGSFPHEEPFGQMRLCLSILCLVKRILQFAAYLERLREALRVQNLHTPGFNVMLRLSRIQGLHALAGDNWDYQGKTADIDPIQICTQWTEPNVQVMDQIHKILWLFRCSLPFPRDWLAKIQAKLDQ